MDRQNEIMVETFTRDTYTVRRKPMQCIFDVKEQLQAKTGFPICTMRVIHNGECLKDKDRVSETHAKYYVAIIPKKCTSHA